MKYQYALLLDDLFPNENSKEILNILYSQPGFDITIFVLNKEQIIPNSFPVFNIADYFNFNGVTVITSKLTLEKARKYPVNNMRIVLGDIPDELCVNSLDFNLIERKVNEHYDVRH